MNKITIVDFHTYNTLDRARNRTLLEAELAFYKKAAESAASDTEKMLEALKAGETVTIGSSVFGGLKIMRVPESDAPSTAVMGEDRT